MKNYLLILSLLVAVASMPIFADPASGKVIEIMPNAILEIEPNGLDNVKPMTKKAIAIKTSKIVGYAAEVVLPIVVYLGLVKGAELLHKNDKDKPLCEEKNTYQGVINVIQALHKESFKNPDHIELSYYCIFSSMVIATDLTVLALVIHGIYDLQKELKPVLQPVVKKLAQKYKARKAAKTA